MKRQYKFAEEADLIDVAVPANTDTYIAVSNEVALVGIRSGLTSMGLKVQQEEYKLSNNKQIATGRLYVGDLENGLQRCIGWINSYDKSKALGIACGANVFICANGMFTSEIVTLRKHTKNVLDDMNGMIAKALRYLEVSFNNAKQSKTYFEKVILDKSAVNEIIGQLYLEEELIKNYQLSIIKDGLEKDTKFDMRAHPTMWNLYNLLTETFKRSHPSTYLEDHVNLHKYMMGKVKEWNLLGIPTPYTLVEDVPAPKLILPIEASIVVPEIIVPEPVLAEDLNLQF